MDCAQEDCAVGERYCADAVLEHHGRSFTRKSCAAEKMCNSTGDECVAIFSHDAGFTDCTVQCCEGKLCNPYNVATLGDKNSLLLMFMVCLVFTELL